MRWDLALSRKLAFNVYLALPLIANTVITVRIIKIKKLPGRDSKTFKIRWMKKGKNNTLMQEMCIGGAPHVGIYCKILLSNAHYLLDYLAFRLDVFSVSIPTQLISVRQKLCNTHGV